MGYNTHLKRNNFVIVGCNMRFTPQQVQEMVGISRDALRHWRKVLPPLRDRNGYRPCFTLGDALALKVIKLMVEDFGVAPGAMTKLSAGLFSLCGQRGWTLRDDIWLIVNPRVGLLKLTENLRQHELDNAVLLIPLGQLMEELHRIVLSGMEETPDPQRDLSLPPSNVKRSG